MEVKQTFLKTLIKKKTLFSSFSRFMLKCTHVHRRAEAHTSCLV